MRKAHSVRQALALVEAFSLTLRSKSWMTRSTNATLAFSLTTRMSFHGPWAIELNLWTPGTKMPSARLDTVTAGARQASCWLHASHFPSQLRPRTPKDTQGLLKMLLQWNWVEVTAVLVAVLAVMADNQVHHCLRAHVQALHGLLRSADNAPSRIRLLHGLVVLSDGLLKELRPWS
jgi:hypothetical protein